MSEPVAAQGLHHLTAIAGDPQRNLDFYSGVLGLRLVKHTVNFDDPGSLHLYYGDGVGSPGTLLTFFPWREGATGLRGVHQPGSFTLRVPQASLGFWVTRFIEHGVAYRGPQRHPVHATDGTQTGAQSLELKDPDGIDLRLLAHGPAGAAVEWAGAPVPGEYAVQGLHAIELWVLRSQATIQALERLGYRVIASRENFIVMQSGGGTGQLEVRETGQFLRGREGVGTIHHVALRVEDDDALRRLAAVVVAEGMETTEVRDRNYFRSVYFREPGGVLLELATAAPGFLIDESEAELGSSLQLPPQYEPLRARLSLTLPELIR